MKIVLTKAEAEKVDRLYGAALEEQSLPTHLRMALDIKREKTQNFLSGVRSIQEVTVEVEGASDNGNFA